MTQADSDRESELIARLRAESERLSGYSLDAGRADAGIASNLAEDAAAALERKDAEIASARREGEEAGLARAGKFVDQLWNDYVAEHGIYDTETGVIEYPGNGDEYVSDLQELADALRALPLTDADRAGDFEELLAKSDELIATSEVVTPEQKRDWQNLRRRDGHSKLVYDKATRTIVAVDPHPAPSSEAGEWQRDIFAKLADRIEAGDFNITLTVSAIPGAKMGEPEQAMLVHALRLAPSPPVNRELVEALEKASVALDVPPHKRDDRQFLTASINIARSFVHAALSHAEAGDAPTAEQEREAIAAWLEWPLSAYDELEQPPDNHPARIHAIGGWPKLAAAIRRADHLKEGGR